MELTGDKTKTFQKSNTDGFLYIGMYSTIEYYNFWKLIEYPNVRKRIFLFHLKVFSSQFCP